MEMICPHCGAALAHGLDKCNCCGKDLNAQQPPQEQPPQYQPPQYQTPPYQPQYQQAPYQPPYQQAPYQAPPYQPPYQAPPYAPPKYGTESKKVFYRDLAPKKLKIQWQLTTVTMILALLLIIAGIIFPMVRPILRIPSVTGMLSAAGISVRDITDGINMLYDELSKEYDLGYWDGKELDMAEDLLEALDRLSGNFNLLDISRLAKSLRNEFDDVLREYLSYSDMQVLDMIVQIPTIIIISIVVSFLLPLTLTLLAGLKKNLGLTIAAMILTLLSMVIINGWAFATATLVIFIPQIVFCANTRKGYKDYQLGYI